MLSCTSDRKVNSEAVRKEIKSREIKRATEAEIVSKVQKIGNSIVLSAKKMLGKNLKQSIESGGVENAVSFCNLNAMTLIDSLNRSFGVEIRRASLKARNQSDLPNALEKALLEAYAYQWKDSIPLQTNVQALDENRYLFTKPIHIDNDLCLKCHGTMENGLSKEIDDFIKLKYPNDKATGYQIGDLRGIWSITIPKKMVVQSL
ncbi:MAG: DUF3365 domain-containing protein [Cyclobacteriaceae bacterium]|nr:DUF3365 domain-containing protein [Cyclobacteriaceae bacterium]